MSGREWPAGYSAQWQIKYDQVFGFGNLKLKRSGESSFKEILIEAREQWLRGEQELKKLKRKMWITSSRYLVKVGSQGMLLQY